MHESSASTDCGKQARVRQLGRGSAVAEGGTTVTTMTTAELLERVVRDQAVLLAAAEQVAKSMNGASARRLAQVLDELSLDPTGSLLADDERAWISEAVTSAERSGRVIHWGSELDRLADLGVTVAATFDTAYPTNLQLIHDRPPLLFIRGHLDPRDRRAVAVVGTRECTDRGRKVAAKIAADLADAGVAVASGLAKGIDYAAHRSAIGSGGTTVAVFGTPIDRVYPAAHRDLAAEIVESGGALVSQFLPGATTGPWAFPIRNVTMSGISAGTIVIEASETSGARIQAEAAVAHGKRLFLVESLVTGQPWARAMADLPGVTIASSSEDILTEIQGLVSSPGGDVLL